MTRMHEFFENIYILYDNFSILNAGDGGPEGYSFLHIQMLVPDFLP